MGASEILDSILTEEQLSILIKVPPDLSSLQVILDIKLKRIQNNTSGKESFPLDFIYENYADRNVDVKCVILQKALEIQDNDDELKKGIHFIMNTLHRTSNENCYENFKLLHCLIEFCKFQSKISIFSSLVDLSHIEDRIILILKEPTNKTLDSFIITTFLTSYLLVQPSFVRDLFNLVYDSKRLDIICSLYNQFICHDLSVLSEDRFYVLLSECLISNRNSLLQKQAIFLLSKCLNSDFHSPYLKATSEDAWGSFMILVDASNEKQLHLIEPCLNLLPSIKHLHEMWQISLYKILLGHNQVSVIYSVAVHVLENTNWNTFSNLLETFLCAINKHEFSSASNKLFNSLGAYCSKLEKEQFHILIDKSLNVSWCCAAIWSFYKHIFEVTSIELNHSLFDRLMSKCEQIPDLYVREGCIQVCIVYFEKCSQKNPQNFIKLSCLILRDDDQKDDSYFEMFLKKNEKWALQWFEHAEQENYLGILKWDNLHILDVQLRVLKYFNLKNVITDNVMQKSIKFDISTDLTFFMCSDIFDTGTIQKYISNRLDDLGNNDEDLSAFTYLIRNKTDPDMFLPKVLQILETFDLNSSNKKYAALTIMYYNCESARDHAKGSNVVNDWIGNILKANQKVDEKITEIVTKLLFDSYEYELRDIDFKFLERIFDSQIAEATFVIFKNVRQIMTLSETSQSAMNFLDRIFSELLKICNNNIFKKSVEIVYSQFFSSDHPKHTQSEIMKIFKLTEDLMKLDNFDHCALILSKMIPALVTSELDYNCYIPLICELMLHGVVINKSDRVEYYINQDIHNWSAAKRLLVPYVRITDQNNPNVQRSSVRFWAMLSTLPKIHCEISDEFAKVLLEKYREHFSKRYFPNSKIHIRKLRILQALLRISHKIQQHQRTNLIELIGDSFLLESHQPSVKHSMQWLLIILLQREKEGPLNLIKKKIEQANLSRPSSVACFIPVLYHLVAKLNRTAYFDEAIEILSPFAMGSQFKLRAFSQIAISKLRRYYCNGSTHTRLFDAVDSVISSSGDTFKATVDFDHDFLNYLFSSLTQEDRYYAIYYTIPRFNGVERFEWENLRLMPFKENRVKNLFDHNIDEQANDAVEDGLKSEEAHHSNVQRKTTPWRENLEEVQNTSDLILVTSLVEKASNLGGLCRTCEVFGVKSVVMRTAKVVGEKEFKSLSMSSENWLNITEVKPEDLKAFIAEVKTRGYSVIGAEQTSESVKINEFEFPKKTVLVLGNEKAGIPPDLIPHLEFCVEIPQWGVVRSLNVHVAGAVMIWEYSKQHS